MNAERVSWEMNHSPDDYGFRPLMGENEERVAFAHAPLLALLLLSVLKTFFFLFSSSVRSAMSAVQYKGRTRGGQNFFRHFQQGAKMHALRYQPGACG